MKVLAVAVLAVCALVTPADTVAAQMQQCWICHTNLDPEGGSVGAFCKNAIPGGQEGCVVSCGGTSCDCITWGDYCSFAYNLLVAPTGDLRLFEGPVAVGVLASLWVECDADADADAVANGHTGFVPQVLVPQVTGSILVHGVRSVPSLALPAPTDPRAAVQGH
ncbi:MAG: hypothetical protein WD043_01830 [Gemmatimonadales bacterium]